MCVRMISVSKATEKESWSARSAASAGLDTRELSLVCDGGRFLRVANGGQAQASGAHDSYREVTLSCSKNQLAFNPSRGEPREPRLRFKFRVRATARVRARARVGAGSGSGSRLGSDPPSSVSYRSSIAALSSNSLVACRRYGTALSSGAHPSWPRCRKHTSGHRPRETSSSSNPAMRWMFETVSTLLLLSASSAEVRPAT
eukprot:scaffold49777_cov85-Phaeocystis_antarctica.AAC.3